jgi:predicted ArsR family transcriptional regulator
VTDAEKETILDEIVRLADRAIVGPGDVQASDLARRMGITDVTARRDLNKLVDEGKATSRLAYDPASGRRVRVWRLLR